VGRDGGNKQVIWIGKKQENFCKQGWTETPNQRSEGSSSVVAQFMPHDPLKSAFWPNPDIGAALVHGSRMLH
jgi:hypothetical protein